MSILHYVQLRIVLVSTIDFLNGILHYVQLRMAILKIKLCSLSILHYVQLVIKNKSLYSMQAFLFLFIINFEKYVIIIIRYNLKWK